jgi:putative hydrolase of the HAD superfamily
VKFEAVLFDLGGTLIIYENKYTWKELALLGCRSAVPVVKEITGIEVAAKELWEELLRTIDWNLKEHADDLAEIRIYDIIASILGKFDIEVTDGLPARFLDSYYRPTTEQIALVPGAADILSRLKDAGLKIGLISNSIFPSDFHRGEMKRFGILDYFDFTIFSSEVGIRKPRKDIFMKALSLAGSSPRRTIFVGDRLVEDIAGPQSVGIRAILKFDNRRDYSEPIKPCRTIYDLKELEEMIINQEEEP